MIPFRTIRRSVVPVAAMLALLPSGLAGFTRHQEDLDQRHLQVFGPASLIIEDSRPRPLPAEVLEELAEAKDLAETLRVERAIEMLGESPVATVLEHLPAEARRFNDHVLTLANPFFEGRAPGTAGNRYAADYIEFYFRQFDLEPAFATTTSAHDGTEVIEPRSSFRQPFSSGRRIHVADRSAAMIFPGAAAGGGRRELAEDRDFTVLGISGSGRATGPVVFAGYGIDEGPDEYTSFPEGTDFTGQIVMILRFEPMDVDGGSLWAQRGWSPAAQLEAKIAAATERNAAGVVLVNPPGADDPRANALIPSETMISGRRLGRATRGGSAPVMMISRTAAEDLFRAAYPTGEVTLNSAREQADAGSAIFELPGVELELHVRIARQDVMTDNVGAILPGRGELADEFLVIGAHYDHVGYGPAGVINRANLGRLHPGADDNASGTAGMLILAEKLAQAYEELPPHMPARSVLFLAFCAEELGLIGSRHFVDNPPLGIALEDIYLMINLDMIGRLREQGDRGGLTVQGVSSAEGLLDWLMPYFDESDLQIRHVGRVSPNSDHASFHRRDIPVLFFFTGLHPDYHQPSDVGYKINQLGAARIIELTYQIALGLVQRDEPMEFSGRGATRRGAQRIEAAEEPPEQPMRPEVRVQFGIRPASYDEQEPGVAVDGVTEGSSAELAGLEVGDRIVRWNEHEITTVQSWMPLLRDHQPGDVVEVTVIRDGERLTLTATLQGRGPE